jgi:hypothetical protein
MPMYDNVERYSKSSVWFFETTAFNELDSLLDDIQKVYRKRNVHDITKEVNKILKHNARKTSISTSQSEDKSDNKDRVRDYVKNRYPFTHDSCNIQITWNSGITSSVQRFAEVIRDSKFEHDVPVKFKVDLRTGNNTLTVELGDIFRYHLHVMSYSNDQKTASFALNVICDWEKKYRLGNIFVLWNRYSLAILPLLLLLFVFVNMLILLNYTSKRNELIHEAEILLSKGIEEDKRDRALEILLALEIHSKDTSTISFNRPNYILIGANALLLLLAISLLIVPGTQIGIGKGSLYITRWKRWLKLCFYTIPSLLLSIIVIPILQNSIVRLLQL